MLYQIVVWINRNSKSFLRLFLLLYICLISLSFSLFSFVIYVCTSVIYCAYKGGFSPLCCILRHQLAFAFSPHSFFSESTRTPFTAPLESLSTSFHCATLLHKVEKKKKKIYINARVRLLSDEATRNSVTYSNEKYPCVYVYIYICVFISL